MSYILYLFFFGMVVPLAVIVFSYTHIITTIKQVSTFISLIFLFSAFFHLVHFTSDSLNQKSPKFRSLRPCNILFCAFHSYTMIISFMMFNYCSKKLEKLMKSFKHVLTKKKQITFSYYIK